MGVAVGSGKNAAWQWTTWSLYRWFMVLLIVIYAFMTNPLGKLADKMSHARLLAVGLFALIVAVLVLAVHGHWSLMLLGVMLWGIHMDMTQGLLATWVADVAPADLQGTAYGFFNLMSGFAMLVAYALAGLI